MEIQYQRNLKNSYMVIIEEKQPLNVDGELAEKMLERRELPGLLRWISMGHAGDMTFWYQITGLQSLSDLLVQQPLRSELLGRFLAALLALQEELPRYYMKPEHLLLREEQIFLHPSGTGAQFCYEPLWSCPPQEALGALLEQLLPKLDHEDARAVALGYGLYELCQTPNADVWGFVRAQMQETLAEEAVQEAPVEEVSGERHVQKPESEISGLEDSQSELLLEEQKRPARSLPQLLHIAHRKKENGKKENRKKENWKKPAWKKQKQQPSEPLYLFEPEEAAMACENPTVYLGGGQQTQGRLEYMGSGAEKSFVIEGTSFLIGGKGGQADGCLQASGVSRRHARITKEDTGYYIEDLNSRNGTYVNGELLVYKQMYRLQPGDRLRFAREEYVFR